MTQPAMPAGAPAETRGKRKVRVGQVVSNKMQKTIVVRVDRQVRHPRYERVVRTASSFKVHDERNEAKPGDWVRIMETRPLSKDKRWRLVEIMKRASGSPPVPGEEPRTERHAHRPHRPESPTEEPPRAQGSVDRPVGPEATAS